MVPEKVDKILARKSFLAKEHEKYGNREGSHPMPLRKPDQPDFLVAWSANIDGVGTGIIEVVVIISNQVEMANIRHKFHDNLNTYF